MKCSHIDQVDMSVQARATGCEECLKTGDAWVELRVCKTCGHVGCCDSSKNRHARAHWEETGHPIIQPLSSGPPRWTWCYADNAYVDPDGTLR